MIRDTVTRWKNTLIVSGAVILGILVPFGGSFLAPLVTPIVVFLVYSSLRDLQLSNTPDSYLSIVWPALAITYIGLPLVAKGVSDLLLSGSALTGVLIIVAAPTTAGSAIVWTRLADGNTEHAAVTALISILLAPIVTPSLLTMLSPRTIDLAAGPIIRELFVVIASALVLRWLIPDEVVSESWVQRGSMPAIVVLVYVSVATSSFTDVTISVIIDVGIIAFVVVSVGLVLTRIARATFRFSRPQARAMFFAGSLKNLGISLLIATTLGVDAAVVGIVVFYTIQQLSSSVIAEVI